MESVNKSYLQQSSMFLLLTDFLCYEILATALILVLSYFKQLSVSGKMIAEKDV